MRTPVSPLALRFRSGLLLAAGVTTACATAETPRDSTPTPSPRTIPIADAVEDARDALPDVVRYDRHFVLQGELRLVVSAPDSARAAAALAAGRAAADSVARLIADDDHSEIAAVNRRAGVGPVEVSPWTEELVAASLAWAERTGGAFDPTIAPVARLWGFGQGGGAVPTDDAVAAAMEHVGWEKVEHDPEAHTVFLTRPGMSLDLRAAAKGFALDRMREAMEGAGATRGVVDLDGNLLFFGPGPAESNRWSATLSNPYAPRVGYARLEVPAGALSTSAALKRTIEIEGKRYGHLIDPRTGRPAGGLASVTVYAPDGITADILSTALFVLGAERGRELVEGLDDVEAAFVIEGEPGERAEVVFTADLEPRVGQVVPPLQPSFREDT